MAGVNTALPPRFVREWKPLGSIVSVGMSLSPLGEVCGPRKKRGAFPAPWCPPATSASALCGFSVLLLYNFRVIWLYLPSASFWKFFFLSYWALSIRELNSPATIVDLSFFPFISVDFSFIWFEAQLLDVYVFRTITCSWRIDFLSLWSVFLYL